MLCILLRFPVSIKSAALNQNSTKPEPEPLPGPVLVWVQTNLDPKQLQEINVF